MSDPRFNIEIPVNSFNEALLRSGQEQVQLKKRRERLLPPIPGWNPSGAVSSVLLFLLRMRSLSFRSVSLERAKRVRTQSLLCVVLVEDTENWRRELARIAETVGLVTSDELLEIETRKETPLTPTNRARPSTGQYSRQTGRWNETPKTGNRSRSARRRTPLSAAVPSHLFCVDEHEREMWVRISTDHPWSCFVADLHVSLDATSPLSNLTNGKPERSSILVGIIRTSGWALFLEDPTLIRVSTVPRMFPWEIWANPHLSRRRH